MGKRKSARKPMTKKREKLDTIFDCPICNDSKSTDYKPDKKAGVGTIYCRSCFASYTQSISGLTEAIDLYSDWVDNIENNVSANPKEDSYNKISQRYQEEDPGQYDEEGDLFGEEYEEDDGGHHPTDRHSASRPSAQHEEDDLFGDEEEDYEPEYPAATAPRNHRPIHDDYDDEEEEDYDEPPSKVPARSKRYIQSDSEEEEEPAPRERPRKNQFIYSDGEEDEEEDEEAYF